MCLGYSEVSIVNLANHLHHSDDLQKATKNLWGRVVIDDRLATDYKFAHEEMIWLDTDVVNHRCLPLEIGRGCIFKCKFCAFPMNGKKNLDFVKRSDLLREELQRNFDMFGVENYMIVDDTFNDYEEKIDEISDVVQSLSFTPKFWAYTRLDLLHVRQDSLPKLYDLGMRAFYFGIETLNPESGKVVGKGYDFDKSVATLHRMRQQYPDITTHGSFIIGLPYETMESCSKTFERCMSQDVPLHSWRFNPLEIQKHHHKFAYLSEFDKNWRQYGYRDTEAELESYGDSGVIKGSPGMVWANQHMTYLDAVAMTEHFTTASRNSSDYKLTGMFVWELSTLGFDYKDLIGVAWKDFDWHKVESDIRPRFINEYKRKLLELVKTQNNLRHSLVA